MEMSYSHIDFWKLFLKNLFMKPLAIALLMLWKRLKNFTFFSPLFNNDSMYFTLTFLTTFDCIRDISSYTKNTNSSRMFDNNAHDSHSGKPMCERERSRSGLTVECNTLLESNLVESSLSCLHYARAIWTHSSFLYWVLPFTLISHENRAFQERSSNQRNLETPALRFSVDLKTVFFVNEEGIKIMWFF